MADTNQNRAEALGPAERILNTLLTYTDHLHHGRPGIVVPAPGTTTGVRWDYATYKMEGDQKVAYLISKVGTKTNQTRAGVIGVDGKVRDGTRVIGEYRQPGLFPEVAAWMYRQVASVYELDNEFVARWASYAFTQDHKDLKVVLAAFLLVQGRRGDPILDGGKVAFYDEDYRDVGEAMCLIRRKGGDFNPRILLRVGDFLRLPVISQINRELGFTTSAKNPALGRYNRVVEKYLLHRETNPKMLDSLVKEGFRTTIIALAQRVHYKPISQQFFQTLRWKQQQAGDGRRVIGLDMEVAAAESWEGLSEAEICARIEETRPSYKRIVGLLPKSVGVTRAIMAAAVGAGSFSDQDIIIATPTFEDLGLIDVEPIKSKLAAAIKRAQDQRAVNIAARVKNDATKKLLETAADNAMTKAVAKVVKGLRIYMIVDISGSMGSAIDQAKDYIGKLLGGFPMDKLHVSVFNTTGREVIIPHASRAGVDNAFRGIQAGGGTDYGAGVRVLSARKPNADEDAIFIFVGDEQASAFAPAVQTSGINPVAFGLVKIGPDYASYNCVSATAQQLGIPCFRIDNAIFNDVYAIPRALQALIAATPVGVAPRATPGARVSLVDTILKTDLLTKPAWAA